MNGSFWRLPLRITWPSSIAIRSPGPATTRLMKLTSARLASVGWSHGLAGRRRAAAALVVLLGAGRRVEDDDVADVGIAEARRRCG